MVRGPPPMRVQAIADLVSTESGELPLKRGDVITVLAAQYEHWWRGESKGRIGIFPKNYVRQLEGVTLDTLVNTAKREMEVENMAPTIYALLDRLRNPPPVKGYDPLADEELRSMYAASATAWSTLVGVMNAYATRLATMRALNETWSTADQLFRDTTQRALRGEDPMQPELTKLGAAGDRDTANSGLGLRPAQTHALHQQAVQHAIQRTQPIRVAGASQSTVDTAPLSMGATPAPHREQSAVARYPTPPPGLSPSDPAYAEWYHTSVLPLLGTQGRHQLVPAASLTTQAAQAALAHAVHPTSVAPATTTAAAVTVPSWPAGTPTLTPASAPGGTTHLPHHAQIPQPPPGMELSSPAYAEWYSANVAPHLHPTPTPTPAPAHGASTQARSPTPTQKPAPIPTPTPARAQAYPLPPKGLSTSDPAYAKWYTTNVGPIPTAAADTKSAATSFAPTGVSAVPSAPVPAAAAAAAKGAGTGTTSAAVPQPPPGLQPSDPAYAEWYFATFGTPRGVSADGGQSSVLAASSPDPAAGPASSSMQPVPEAGGAGSVPKDEEKRRLFEKAQAEVAQYQAQRHAGTDAAGGRSGSAGAPGGSRGASAGSGSAGGPVPKDEEKRRLFEKAQAEVVQYHAQHAAQAQTQAQITQPAGGGQVYSTDAPPEYTRE